LIVASATAPHADVTATFSSAPARARATTPIARVSRLAKAIARLAVVVRRVVASRFIALSARVVGSRRIRDRTTIRRFDGARDGDRGASARPSHGARDDGAVESLTGRDARAGTDEPRRRRARDARGPREPGRSRWRVEAKDIPTIARWRRRRGDDDDE